MGRNENGTGSWRTLPSGKIFFEKRYTAKNGAKKRLQVTGKDRTECKKLMKEKEEQFEIASRVEMPMQGLLEDCMLFWLDNVKKADAKCSDTAFTRIMSTYETHIKGSYLGKTPEEQVKDKDIIRFMSELQKHSYGGKIIDEELSYSSKKKVYDLLNMYFCHKYIRANELNPMLTVPAPLKDKYIKREGKVEVEEDDESNLKQVPLASVWNDEQMLAIHEYCMKPFEVGKSGSVKRGPLISFLMWTSLRIGELRALTWADICLEVGNESVSVTKTWKKRKVGNKWEWYIGKPKSERGIRNIQLIPRAVEAIKEYKRRFPPKNETDFICINEATGKVLHGNNFNDMLDCIFRGLAFDSMQEKNNTIHGLRHTGISFLIRKQVNRAVVSAMAGHASLSVTEEVYTEIIAEYCREEIIKLGLNI